MPTFRPDIGQLAPYEAGRPIEDVARQYGVTDLIKLASNESPLPPFPEVQAAIESSIAGLNRYPDNNWRDLRNAIAGNIGCGSEEVWVGGGSSELLRVIALAVGGPGTSAVYAWPSFVIYRMSGIFALTENIEVPLTSEQRHDLNAIRRAWRSDTTVVYICNPNNPTGTTVAGAELAAFIESVPERTLVVIDEAYFEFAEPVETMAELALTKQNVVVTRTFSKVYGLAGLRVGYALGASNVLAELRKAQPPFTVSSLAQVAAIESLRYPHRVAERIRVNKEGRTLLEKELDARGIEHTVSQANFVYLGLGTDSDRAFDHFVHGGVIVRPFGDGWLRVTVGVEADNLRFVQVLDEVIGNQETSCERSGREP